MTKKFLYLTKMSLNKKIKTKWFLITNIIIALCVIALININSIITFFGGSFQDDVNIIVSTSSDLSYNLLKENINNLNNLDGVTTSNLTIKKSDKSSKNLTKKINDNEVIISLKEDKTSYLKGEIISKKKLDNMTYQLLLSSLSSTKTALAIKENNIDPTLLAKINEPINIKRVILSEHKNKDENTELIMSTIFPTIILPFFMLIIFVVQMVGGEISEEKTTHSMEIIISNVSPKTHLLSKVVASNLFAIIQGLLLLIYGFIGLLISTNFFQTSLALPSEVTTVIDSILTAGFLDKILLVIPLILLLMIITFISYSIVAAILASMTVNTEDFNQLLTPIIMLSLLGYYLAIMAGLFEGSTFIKIASYLPFLSAFISPSLYIIGQISLIDILISIFVSLAFIYLLLKYGLKIYKMGVLNYSNEKVWSRLFKSIKTKD
mgnify:CR=1 FL=1